MIVTGIHYGKLGQRSYTLKILPAVVGIEITFMQPDLMLTKTGSMLQVHLIPGGGKVKYIGMDWKPGSRVHVVIA
jgi:hypothetical protein